MSGSEGTPGGAAARGKGRPAGAGDGSDVSPQAAAARLRRRPSGAAGPHRARQHRPAWAAALAVSLALHAGAVLALSAGLLRAPPPRVEPPLSVDVLEAPASLALEAPAMPQLALQPPPPAPPPEVTEVAEAAPAPPEASEAVASRWLYEVVADGRNAARIVRPREGARDTAVAGAAEPSEAGPPAEWQGPPAPPEAPPAATPPAGAVVAPAPLADNPPPVYPAAARRRGLQGLVVLLVRVLPDGSAGALSVAESSGHDLLDQAALDAVAGWRFRPALRDGVAVEHDLEVPLRFVLRGR